MSITNITAAIVEEIIEQSLPYPIKWPNTPPNTPNNATWLRVTFLDFPDEPYTLGMDGMNRTNGLMQVDVFSPKGQARFAANTAIDEVKSFLKTSAVLEYNGQKVLINSASVRPNQSETDWHSMIIEVSFTAYTNRS